MIELLRCAIRIIYFVELFTIQTIDHLNYIYIIINLLFWT